MHIIFKYQIIIALLTVKTSLNFTFFKRNDRLLVKDPNRLPVELKLLVLGIRIDEIVADS